MVGGRKAEKGSITKKLVEEVKWTLNNKMKEGKETKNRKKIEKKRNMGNIY